MKIETKTLTTVSSIALTRKEISTLIEAQEILNKLGDKLEEVDTIEGNARCIYNSIDEIGNNLDYITTLVEIEN